MTFTRIAPLAQLVHRAGAMANQRAIAAGAAPTADAKIIAL